MNRDFERADRQPRQAAFGRERLPHPVGGLSGPREDLSPDRVQVEGPMHDAGVPAGGVHRDLRFLLEDGDAAVVPVRKPIRERGPEDPATDDRDVPGLHGPFSRNRPEFIISVYLQTKRRAAYPPISIRTGPTVQSNETVGSAMRRSSSG